MTDHPVIPAIPRPGSDNSPPQPASWNMTQASVLPSTAPPSAVPPSAVPEVQIEPEELPSLESILERARKENFPVAPLWLPRRVRAHLRAFYSFARLVDWLGDESPGSRESHLRWLASQMRAAKEGRPSHPVVRRAWRSFSALGLDDQPAFDLLEANLTDQRHEPMRTWDDLLAYCQLSAAPVGRFVLGLFSCDQEPLVALSDDVCSALQVIEHLQDIGEDAASGRIYLPAELLSSHGVQPSELHIAPASGALVGAISEAARRCADLLSSGTFLIGQLPWRARPLVAGYVAGGMSTLQALERAGFDPLSSKVAPVKSRTIRSAAGLLLASTTWNKKPAIVGRSEGFVARGLAHRLESPVTEAYRRCEEVVSSQARNFALGMKILARPERNSMYAIYALARRIDDIGDSTGPVEERLSALEQIRAQLSSTDGASDSDDFVFVALADARSRFRAGTDEWLAAWGDLLDGCEADVVSSAPGLDDAHGSSRFETLDDLVAYCRQVAGSIGRLTVGVLGVDYGSRQAAMQRADALGVALQLTNILRDIKEDRFQLGRVYLPREALERFGIDSWTLEPEERLASLVLQECQVAKDWYSQGFLLLEQLSGRARACVATLAGVYYELLGIIQADPRGALAHRASVSGKNKATVLARALMGRSPL